MRTVDLPEALELLERAAQEKGEDHVYPRGPMNGCFYAVGGKPGCIVGHVLSYLDVSPEDMAAIEGWGICQPEPRNWLSRRGVKFTRDAITALSQAQGAQDLGATWRGAVDAARRVAESVTV